MCCTPIATVKRTGCRGTGICAWPALLYVFDIGGAAGKIVVRLDCLVSTRNSGGKGRREPFNSLRSGRRVNAASLDSPGSYELLDGAL
jgi:hypothetical protein